MMCTGKTFETSALPDDRVICCTLNESWNTVKLVLIIRKLLIYKYTYGVLKPIVVRSQQPVYSVIRIFFHDSIDALTSPFPHNLRSITFLSQLIIPPRKLY